MTNRVLIFGGAGMLGHELVHTLAPRYDTWATVRGAQALGLDDARVLRGIDARDPAGAAAAIADVRPDVVVNCIGIVKQRPEAHDPVASNEVNAAFPHRLASACGKYSARLIHLSTDCVFSGRRGNYSEDDVPDPEDLYGQTKLAGEPIGPNCLTLRTSMIGRELQGASGLLEWFLAQTGAVRGFTKAIFSGLTTPVLARLIGDLVEKPLSGLYHVAAEPIAKHDLLLLLRDAFGKSIEIEPDDTVRIDRSLDGTRFREATGFVAPRWPAMVEELAAGAVLEPRRL